MGLFKAAAAKLTAQAGGETKGKKKSTTWLVGKGEKAQEREAEGYSGREVRGNITYIMAADCFAGAVGPEYVVLGMEWTDGIYPKAGT